MSQAKTRELEFVRISAKLTQQNTKTSTNSDVLESGGALEALERPKATGLRQPEKASKTSTKSCPNLGERSVTAVPSFMVKRAQAIGTTYERLHRLAPIRPLWTGEKRRDPSTTVPSTPPAKGRCQSEQKPPTKFSVASQLYSGQTGGAVISPSQLICGVATLHPRNTRRGQRSECGETTPANTTPDTVGSRSLEDEAPMQGGGIEEEGGVINLDDPNLRDCNDDKFEAPLAPSTLYDSGLHSSNGKSDPTLTPRGRLVRSPREKPPTVVKRTSTCRRRSSALCEALDIDNLNERRVSMMPSGAPLTSAVLKGLGANELKDLAMISQHLSTDITKSRKRKQDKDIHRRVIEKQVMYSTLAVLKNLGSGRIPGERLPGAMSALHIPSANKPASLKDSLSLQGAPSPSLYGSPQDHKPKENIHSMKDFVRTGTMAVLDSTEEDYHSEIPVDIKDHIAAVNSLANIVSVTKMAPVFRKRFIELLKKEKGSDAAMNNLIDALLAYLHAMDNGETSPADIDHLIQLLEEGRLLEATMEFGGTTRTALGMKTEDGNTLLHRSIDTGNITMVHYLLSIRCNPFSPDKRGINALERAIYHGHRTIIKILLERFPALAETRTAERSGRMTMLEYAECMGHRDVVEILGSCLAELDLEKHDIIFRGSSTSRKPRAVVEFEDTEFFCS